MITGLNPMSLRFLKASTAMMMTMPTNMKANLALSQLGLWNPCQMKSRSLRLKLTMNRSSTEPNPILRLSDMRFEKKYSGASTRAAVPQKMKGAPSGLTVS